MAEDPEESKELRKQADKGNGVKTIPVDWMRLEREKRLRAGGCLLRWGTS